MHAHAHRNDGYLQQLRAVQLLHGETFHQHARGCVGAVTLHREQDKCSICAEDVLSATSKSSQQARESCYGTAKC